MIYCIRGILNSKNDNYIVVLNNNLGYRFMYYGNDLMLSKEYCFYILTIFNDNVNYYIGYIDENEMLFYKRLLNIKGIGLKSIIKLSKCDYKKLSNYILDCNYEILRNNYNLSEKVVNAIIDCFNIKRNKKYLVDTLVGLGYKKQEVLDNYDSLNAVNLDDNLLLAARIIGRNYE